MTAKDIKPAFILKSNGFVNDMTIDGINLYVANDEGSVEVFDILKRELVKEIFIEPSVTAQGKTVPANILSVDRLNGKTLIVSSTVNMYRNIWIHDGVKLKHVIKLKNKMMVKKARFIDEDNFMFGTVDYDLIKYTTKDNYSVYKSQVEQSSFSDMAISSDKKTMITASESGVVTLSDIKSGKILKKFSSLNVDNIYKIAYKNGNIITAGQDRRVGIYLKSGKEYYIKSDFLVYSVGLSPDGKTAVYSSGEDNNLQIFDLETGVKGDRLVGHDAVPSTIKFFDEKGFFSAGYENSVYYWYLK